MLNHKRPVLAIKGKQIEHKHAERNQWISTKRLAKVKSWQEFMQVYEDKANEIRQANYKPAR